MPTRDNRHMKPGPFQNLIDRAHAVGIDTTGYDTRSSSADRLRNRVVAAEQKRKADGGTIVTKRAVELAGIPTMGQTSTNREKVARDWMNYMLRYVNHLSGGEDRKSVV